ncbi:MAG: purine-nucleoside phosphorylase [Sphaerochaetaceae bacterium]|nr:purine-nucleoside phosphorylase [Sphaerochaetaceae bacterium]MDC7237886.1 purine-nucleoside phosphorylase [Sphaerochaetaceae bacterium]MDC7250816.1 purine-nucleoside phosphorylase [Sphaerochaetaceae bacterium]
MENLLQKLDLAASYIKNKVGNDPIEVAMVLGSGLGDLANEISNPVIIDYKDIPSFPKSTVPGHAGRLVIGELLNKRVLCMQGRFHYYEGYDMDVVVFPIQVMKRLGIENLLLTNAAGCVNENWKPGDLMLITDHIKLVADNPLRGINFEELGPRFFDMSNAYDKDLCNLARSVAKEQNLDLKEGVYQLFTGPSFETPTEVKLARLLGADAVGMSTVPEAIAASHMGMKTLGISCLTNMAAGILDQPLNHEEVLETGKMVKNKFTTLVKAIVKKW